MNPVILGAKMDELKVGSHVLQTGRQLLLDGKRVRLGSKALAVLELLARHPDEIVTKDEIFETVWSETLVEENSLQVHIAAIRKALERDGELIETIRGVGYKLNSPEDANEAGSKIPAVFRWRDQPSSSHSWRESIVVLPFHNRRSGEESEFLCDGLVEDITNALAQLPQLMVISRGTAFEFKKDRASADAIARSLGVNNVLSGSVRQIGNRARVSAILQDSTSGEAKWSRTYDRTLDDIFSVQDELASDIVTALDVALVHGEQARFARESYRDAETVATLYRGMFDFYQLEPTAILRARKQFERFIELEPQSAIGYAWLAQTWGIGVMTGISAPEEALPKMREFGTKALEIDPENAPALISACYFNAMFGNPEEALSFASRAQESAPNSDEALYAKGWAELLLGKTNEAILNLERSVRQSPIPNAFRLGVLGTAYRIADRYEDAINTLNQLIERYPDFVFGYSSLACTRAMSGDIDGAKEMAAEVFRRDPSFTITRFRTPDLYVDKSVMEKSSAALRLAGFPE